MTELDWADEPAPPQSTARSRIGQVVNDRLTDEAIDNLVTEALNATTGVRARCPDCGNEHTVRFPDFKKIVDTVTALLEQAEGRPELARTGPATVIVERPPLGA